MRWRKERARMLITKEFMKGVQQWKWKNLVLDSPTSWGPDPRKGEVGGNSLYWIRKVRILSALLKLGARDWGRTEDSHFWQAPWWCSWSEDHLWCSQVLDQGSPTSRIWCLMIRGGADVIIIEIECTVNVIISPSPGLWKNCLPQPVPGAKKVGDHCLRW